MSNKAKITDAIAAELIAGKGTGPFTCYVGNSPKKKVKLLKKQLGASKNWRVRKDTIWNSSRIYFNGIASWGADVAVLLNSYEHRFKVLQIDRLGCRSCYAIPSSMADNFSSLPDIELNAKEIGLIKEMANELSKNGTVAENSFCVRHPTKSALIENRAQWETNAFDASELLRMMKDIHSLRHIIVAALSAQYRSFLPSEDLPEGVYNFVIPSKSNDSDLWFYTIIQALTFVNVPGKNVSGPITITMKEADDLKRWRCCHERLAVIRTATGALLWSLLEEIEENNQVLKSGGPVSTPLPAVPISLARGYLRHSQAVDIELPSNPPLVTAEQQDLLRTAMSQLLRRKIAKKALLAWNERRALPTAYRTNGLSDWQDCLLDVCLQTWFPGDKNQSVRAELLSDTQRQREEQERAITEALHRSLGLLTEPSKYIDKIVERPSSRSEWGEAVENGAVAFWFMPAKGGDKGKTFLAFTSDTLKVLLLRAGCTEDLCEVFLRRCADQGLLDSRNRTIKLGKDEISAMTFFIQKP